MAYVIRQFRRTDKQNEYLGENNKRTPESGKKTISFRQSFFRRIFFYGPCRKTKKPVKIETRKEFPPTEGSIWNLVTMENRSLWDWSFLKSRGKSQDTRKKFHIPPDLISPNPTKLINANDIHIQPTLNPNPPARFIVPTRRSNSSFKMNNCRNYDRRRKSLESGIGSVDNRKKFSRPLDTNLRRRSMVTRPDETRINSSSKPIVASDCKVHTEEGNNLSAETKIGGNSEPACENEGSVIGIVDENEEPVLKFNLAMRIGIEDTWIQPSSAPIPDSDLFIRNDCTNESLKIISTENFNQGFTSVANDIWSCDDEEEISRSPELKPELIIDEVPNPCFNPTQGDDHKIRTELVGENLKTINSGVCDGVGESVKCDFGSRDVENKYLFSSDQHVPKPAGAIDLHKATPHFLLKPNYNSNVIVPINNSASNNGNENSACEGESVNKICTGSGNAIEKFPLTLNPALTKPMLVIDLDETLIHSSFEPIPNPDFIVPVEMDGIIHQVHVAKRPHVDEFLLQMNQLYECVLWTASLATYADPVTDILDKFGVFKTRLFRDACVFFRGQYVKDLGQLGRSLEQVTILDNSPMCYFFNRDNGVPITSWYDDVKDTELLYFIPFFERLSRVDNVPTVLRNCRRPFYLSTFDPGLSTTPSS